MGAGLLQVEIKGQDDLRRVARALRLADKDGLRRELATAIRQAARPTLDAIQASAGRISTRGYPKPGAVRRFTRPVPAKGTRAKIAAAVGSTVRVAEDNPRVSFTVRSARLPLELRNMPRKFDSGRTWRHPVMGNRNAWVGQSGQPWFWPPIRDNIKTFRGEIEQALERTREQIEGA